MGKIFDSFLGCYAQYILESLIYPGTPSLPTGPHWESVIHDTLQIRTVKSSLHPLELNPNPSKYSLFSNKNNQKAEAIFKAESKVGIADLVVWPSRSFRWVNKSFSLPRQDWFFLHNIPPYEPVHYSWPLLGSCISDHDPEVWKLCHQFSVLQGLLNWAVEDSYQVAKITNKDL